MCARTPTAGAAIPGSFVSATAPLCKFHQLLCLRDFAAHQVLERESQPQELADVVSAAGDAGLNGFLCLVAVEEVVIAPQDQLHGVG